MFVKAKLKNEYLIIELPRQEPKVSGSGKSMVIGSTKGPKNTGIQYKGQDLYVVANAFVRNSEHPRKKAHDLKSKNSGSAGVRSK
jgi:hypothetical protein